MQRFNLILKLSVLLALSPLLLDCATTKKVRPEPPAEPSPAPEPVSEPVSTSSSTIAGLETALKEERSRSAELESERDLLTRRGVQRR